MEIRPKQKILRQQVRFKNVEAADYDGYLMVEKRQYRNSFF
jgi:hypothetical protein